ncbi:MAG: DEAD/DEAH box helicase [Candidatus Zixiibacteriota bacterium]
MKLTDLNRYGVPETIIEAWLKRQGDYLLPLQEKAIRDGLLGNGREPSPNLLISAPTSSGKSFCGELAAVGSLLKRQKTVMLLPLKSIAEEKYDYYQKCYAAIGIKVILVTGDHPENDFDFELGNFDLALAIYEKFNRLLTLNPDILQQIGLIVIDELQMIAEPKRGVQLEMALMKIFNSGYHPRLVALSAVIDDVPELVDWLGCRTVVETVRPVDLYQGVATNGCFRFRSFNDGREGSEEIALSCEKESLADNIIEFLKSDKSAKLVFLRSKKATIDAAFRLASVSGWGEAKKTLMQLEGEETSYLIRSLRQTLSRGIAFHNADLTSVQRKAIEGGYREGEIRVVFATTTLAMGVNLPADTVLLETMKYSSGNFGGKPSLIPISPAEFQNIAGRAGRFGLQNRNRPGRAVALAGSDFEFEVLWSGYIDANKKERLVSALDRSQLTDIVLDLIVSNLAGNIIQLENILRSSLYCRQGNEFDRTSLQAVLDSLISYELITANISATGLGRAVAESGLSIRSGQRYLELLNTRYPNDLPGWLFLALSSPEFDISLAGLNGGEYQSRVYEKLLFQEYGDLINDVSFCTTLKIGNEPLDYEFCSRLKALFILKDWASGTPVERLEQRYQLHHGQIINLAELSAWLIVSVGRLIHAVDCNSNLPHHLEELAFGIQFGINPMMREIYFGLGAILNRLDIIQLERRGLTTLADINRAGRDTLAEIIQPNSKLDKIIEKINIQNKEQKMEKGKFSRQSLELSSFPSIVEFDGNYEKERYLVKVDGFPVRLTGKSFKYLVKLASSRVLSNEGWVYKDDIEIGFNQARYLYRLKQEMKSGGVSWPIFENNRLGYYRLDLNPEKIRFNIDNLKNHPDFELRQMADEIALRATG